MIRIQTRTLLLVSLLGSLLGMVSDFCLLYDPAGAYIQLPKYAFLQTLSAERMWIGHFLGGLFIPFSLFALPALFKVTRASEDEKFNTLVLLIGATFIGVVYHMSLLPFRLWLDLEKFVLNSHIGVFQFLEFLCAIIIATLGLGWWKMAARFQRCKRAKLFANPALTYLVWVIGFLISPNFGGLIWMMGMNLSVLICQIVLMIETKEGI